MESHWSHDAIFYHIYTLGFCGALQKNDFSSPPQPRLDQIRAWIPHLRGMGINAVYLGPLFESSTHGYDTADYYHVDRRLGTDETLIQLVRDLHANEIRVVLDGVFNHVGRKFWAFQDVVKNGQNSPYCGWFQGLHFGGRSPYGDPFTYEAWNGHYELVRLNPHNPETRRHLLEAVRHWIQDFDIDGLRLDAADCLDLGFQRELSAFTHRLRPDFWLMGEVIHGDYRRWVNPETLGSVTNYECYKGLYSSLVDENYFEIAYALNRQFGEGGLYCGLPLYNFADNHDVNRVASNLQNPAHLYPLYCLLFSMPGIPSIFYGSEWGLQGIRTPNSDAALRPHLDLDRIQHDAPQPDLPAVLQKLARIRHDSRALRRGDYRQLFVSHQQLAFSRRIKGETVFVLLNAADVPCQFDIPTQLPPKTRLVDVLNGGEDFQAVQGRLVVNEVSPHWARILKNER
jgi:cyclomaltodextrinase / maltogenic alpha-amylase / neopullulanase